jgi:hypothetical protein
MLPGFRFLFAAIVLSMSILIFGLGAAALLRAAHEQFVSNPSWHATPETMFAQQSDASRPVLAMMHVEPAVPEQAKAPDDVPAAPAPREQATSVAPPAEPAPIVAAQTEPEKAEALTPEQAAPAELAKPEIPAAQSPAPNGIIANDMAANDMAAAKTDAPVSPDAPAAETKVAATGQALTGQALTEQALTEQALTEQALPPANETAPALSEASPPNPASALTSAAPDAAATKIATLGGPPVTIKAPPPAKAADAKSDNDALKKRLQARRTAQRRKIAARGRVARQLTPQPASQFAQPFAQPPAPARNP